MLHCTMISVYKKGIVTKNLSVRRLKVIKMCTSKYKRTILFHIIRFKLFLYIINNIVRIELCSLCKFHQSGHWQKIYSVILIYSVKQVFKLIFPDSYGSCDNHYPLLLRTLNGRFYSRFHSKYGNAVSFPEFLYCNTGRCVACNHYCLHSLFKQKLRDADRIAKDLLRGFQSVRDVLCVSVKYVILLRKIMVCLVKYWKTTYSGIKNTDLHFWFPLYMLYFIYEW